MLTLIYGLRFLHVITKENYLTLLESPYLIVSVPAAKSIIIGSLHC